MCFSTPWTVVSTQARGAKPMLNPFVKIFLIKKCFSKQCWIYIYRKNSEQKLFPFYRKNKSLIYWVIFVYLIAPTLVRQKIPYSLSDTRIYNRPLFRQKSHIYWMTLIHITEPPRPSKIPYLLNDTRLYNKPPGLSKSPLFIKWHS